jgi:hypothetical protein
VVRDAGTVSDMKKVEEHQSDRSRRCTLVLVILMNELERHGLLLIIRISCLEALENPVQTQHLEDMVLLASHHLQ